MDELQFVTQGSQEQPAVLFLHGFLGSADDWKEVVYRLRHAYFCICVDLPGHGRSTGLTEERSYTMAGAAEMLLQVLERVQAGPANIVGYSMGGRTALYFAVHHPEACRKLVLESASPGLKSETERNARRGVDEARATRLESGDFSEFLEAWYRQPLFESYARHEGLLHRTMRARLTNEPSELARALRGMGTGRQRSLWGRISELQTPTLAMAGATDGKFVEIAEQMAVLMPNVRAAIMPNAGHTVHAEHPAAFADVLNDFLKKPI